MNIIINAIDALRVAPQSQASPDTPTICIETEIQDKTLIVTIADNGVGMDIGTCRRVFDPFFTTKPVGKGTGLGLAIAHQIVTENHHGEIHVQSQRNQGTEFAIHLPL